MEFESFIKIATVVVSILAITFPFWQSKLHKKDDDKNKIIEILLSERQIDPLYKDFIDLHVGKILTGVEKRELSFYSALRNFKRPTEAIRVWKKYHWIIGGFPINNKIEKKWVSIVKLTSLLVIMALVSIVIVLLLSKTIQASIESSEILSLSKLDINLAERVIKDSHIFIGVDEFLILNALKWASFLATLAASAILGFLIYAEFFILDMIFETILSNKFDIQRALEFKFKVKFKISNAQNDKDKSWKKKLIEIAWFIEMIIAVSYLPVLEKIFKKYVGK